MAYYPPKDPTEVMGRRIAAYFIDGVLSGVITVALLAATKSQSYTDAPHRACATLREATDFSGTCTQFGSHVYTWTGGRFVLALLLSALISAANLVLLQGRTGASLGKMVVGLRTVDAQGNPCGIGRALVRWLLLFVDSFFCALVGLITALVTHPHRRIGDMVASTYVVAAADAGKPIPSVGAPPQYAYAPAPGGWGAPPPGAQPQQPAWGAQPQQPAWGAQPQQPAWGAQPQQPAWGAPASAPPAPATDQPAWGAPPPAQPQQPAWGASPTPPPGQQAAPPAPPSPAAEQPAWGAPAAPPPPPPTSEPVPPAPEQPPTMWAPPPPPPATPPPAPTPPPPSTPPPDYGAPPHAPANDAPSASPPPAPEQSGSGESWWDKALGDDDQPKQ